MGRGWAAVIVVATLLLMMLVQTEECNSTPSTFVVGGKLGWSFKSITWPRYKQFKAGDYLVFKYNSSYHNVVAVDRLGYKTCSTARPGSMTYESGNDRIRLRRGMNYFICGIPNHCKRFRMKMAVRAY